LESFAQTTAVEPEQISPAEVQIELVHVHVADPDGPEQLSFESVHALAVPQVPFVWQVSISVPLHCVVPGVHAAHAPPRQTGVAPEQGVDVAS
jgi:hypothetical protein